MKRLFLLLASPFAWRKVGEQGHNDFFENRITGKRDMVRTSQYCFTPLAGAWGEWLLNDGPLP